MKKDLKDALKLRGFNIAREDSTALSYGLEPAARLKSKLADSRASKIEVELIVNDFTDLSNVYKVRFISKLVNGKDLYYEMPILLKDLGAGSMSSAEILIELDAFIEDTLKELEKVCSWLLQLCMTGVASR